MPELVRKATITSTVRERSDLVSAVKQSCRTPVLGGRSKVSASAGKVINTSDQESQRCMVIKTTVLV